MSAIVVMAKAPVAGRVKTRLCPPFTLEEAAALAEAALIDTLENVGRTEVVRSGAAQAVLALEGRVGAWFPTGWRVVSQRGNDLGERLAAAFADVPGPALLVGMDTPQVDAEVLDAAWDNLDGCFDAVLGLAADGGWWALGLRHAVPGLFDGVPMSTAETGAMQLARMHTFGLRVAMLPRAIDVDDVASAEAVVAATPDSRFAARFRTLTMTASR